MSHSLTRSSSLEMLRSRPPILLAQHDELGRIHCPPREGLFLPEYNRCAPGSILIAEDCRMKRLGIAALALLSLVATAQDAPTAQWDLQHRLEIRANWRDSHQERFQLRFPFPPEFLPVGQTAGFMETVDAGTHTE